MDNNALTQVIEALGELMQDHTVPKNVKARFECMISHLNDDSECSIKVSRAIHEIEEITEDVNIQSYTRTQIFNVVSLLEMI